MENNSFLDRFKSLFGYNRPPPANDFRNPIWGSDDDDDGDELYSREQQMDVLNEASRIHEEFTKQMHDALDMFKTFGHIIGDMKDFFQQDEFTPSITEIPDLEGSNNSNIRNYYLKPGFHSQKFEQPKQDVDLDGKISSNEISGLLKKGDGNKGNYTNFDAQLMPGKSFFQTIITTSVKKPDGTVETRRIVKNGNEVIEETTTTSTPADNPGANPGLFLPNSDIMNNAMSQAMSQFSTIFSKFY